MKLTTILGKLLLLVPIVKYKQLVYKFLGVNEVKDSSYKCRYFIGNPRVIGQYNNIYLHNNAEIERNCFLLAKDRIEIGENTTLAYGVTILTGADPNGPLNKLSKLYPPIKAPVKIGKDCWIGANAVILPGVTIGDIVVVAAGSVVTKDIPSKVMIAGVPAVIKKNLEL
jgi:PREDICTED: hypothetical protein